MFSKLTADIVASLIAEETRCPKLCLGKNCNCKRVAYHIIDSLNEGAFNETNPPAEQREEALRPLRHEAGGGERHNNGDLHFQERLEAAVAEADHAAARSQRWADRIGGAIIWLCWFVVIACNLFAVYYFLFLNRNP